MKGQYVPIKLIVLSPRSPIKLKKRKLRYIGTMMSCGGTINVKMAIAKISPLPGKRKRARPYPTSVHEATCRTLVVSASKNELVKALTYSMWTQTSWKLRSVGFLGIQRTDWSYRSSTGMSAVDNLLMRGSKITKQMPIKRIVLRKLTVHLLRRRSVAVLIINTSPSYST